MLKLITMNVKCNYLAWQAMLMRCYLIVKK